jgi:hypothetical protein
VHSGVQAVVGMVADEGGDLSDEIGILLAGRHHPWNINPALMSQRYGCAAAERQDLSDRHAVWHS